MVDTGYTIHGDGITLQPEFTTGEIPIPTRGEMVTYEFALSESEFNTLYEYTDYAGAYSAYEGDDGEYRYIEHLPTNPDTDSLLVGIEPSQDLQDRDVPGVWGLVETVTDARNQSLTTERIDLEVFVIAEYDDFNNITAVREARDVETIGQNFEMEAQTVGIEGGEMTAVLLSPAFFDVTINDLTFTSEGTPANFDVTIDNLEFVGDVTETMTAQTVDVTGGNMTFTLIGGNITETMDAASVTINGGEMTVNLV